MDDSDKKANADFFAGKGGDGQPSGEDDSNMMTEGLEEQQAELDGNDDDFVVVNEEDHKEDDGAADDSNTDDTDDTTPVVESQMSEVIGALGTLTELQRQQIENSQKTSDPAADLDPQPEIDYSDPESVKSWTEWNTRESARVIDSTIQKYHTENVLPVQNLALTQAHQTQIAEAKGSHGDRFDWKRDQKDIEAVQAANPSLTVADAFRHIDYSRMQSEITNKAEKATELSNSSGVSSGPASAASKKVGDPITLVATAEDRNMAAKFDMSIKDWMKSKYQHETAPGGSLL